MGYFIVGYTNKWKCGKKALAVPLSTRSKWSDYLLWSEYALKNIPTQILSCVSGSFYRSFILGLDMKIYIDGKYFGERDAKISVFDHGLLYGDGIFEGIRAYNG